MKLALFAAVLSGCSFVYAHGPDAKPDKCDHAVADPVIDGIVGALGIAASMYLFSAAEDSETSGPAVVSLGVGAVSVALIASSIYGFVLTGQCHNAGLM